MAYEMMLWAILKNKELKGMYKIVEYRSGWDPLADQQSHWEVLIKGIFSRERAEEIMKDLDNKPRPIPTVEDHPGVNLLIYVKRGSAHNFILDVTNLEDQHVRLKILSEL